MSIITIDCDTAILGAYGYCGSNIPSFCDYIASAIGSRDWYTRARPCPVTARNRHYISPARWRDLKGAYEQTFGREAW